MVATVDIGVRWSVDLPGLHVLLTDRRGGASSAPWHGANLGGHVGDDPAAVETNRRALARRVGVPRDHLLLLRQVHGTRVVEATGPWPGQAPEADAAVTATRGVALAVLVADCVPVLLADPVAGVAGVAHAGRAGLAAGVVPAVVDALRRRGARLLQAWVGPSVCGACYEVPAPLQEQVAAVVPAARATTRAGTPALDVAAGVLAQLDASGVAAERVAGCTREDDSLYSYRRDGTTGRSAGVVVLR